MLVFVSGSSVSSLCTPFRTLVSKRQAWRPELAELVPLCQRCCLSGSLLSAKCPELLIQMSFLSQHLLYHFPAEPHSVILTLEPLEQLKQSEKVRKEEFARFSWAPSLKTLRPDDTKLHKTRTLVKNHLLVSI